MSFVNSESDDRTVNNDVRHLNDAEKAAMIRIKDVGRELLTAIDDSVTDDPRCRALARTKAEEAVMWAVKGITK